jgi:hypothetical protein
MHKQVPHTLGFVLGQFGQRQERILFLQLFAHASQFTGDHFVQGVVFWASYPCMLQDANRGGDLAGVSRDVRFPRFAQTHRFFRQALDELAMFTNAIIAPLFGVIVVIFKQRALLDDFAHIERGTHDRQQFDDFPWGLESR